MLKTLLKTLALQAWNYLRDKFDRVTIFYIGLIGLVSLYLIGRSPADIGFQIADMNTASFAQKWFGIFCGLLPFFYLFAEFSAYNSARASAANMLLWGLPVRRKIITDFALLTTLFKISVPLLFFVLPFLLGQPTLSIRISQLFSSIGMLIALAFFGWVQAMHMQQFLAGMRKKIVPWLLLELVMLTSLFTLAENVGLQLALCRLLSTAAWPGLLFIACIAGYFFIARYYPQHVREKISTSILPHKRTGARWMTLQQHDYFYLALHDFLFVRKHKRSILFLQLFGAALAVMVSIHGETAQSALGAVIFMQGIWSLFLVNSLTALFKRDAEAHCLLRSLPIAPMQLWLGRWLFVGSMLALPFLLPHTVVLSREATVQQAGIIAVALSTIPALAALVYTTIGFGTFPHFNFGANMMNIVLLFMILFWFYLPFGSLIILILMLIWIRKSLRNLKMVELS